MYCAHEYRCDADRDSVEPSSEGGSLRLYVCVFLCVRCTLKLLKCEAGKQQTNKQQPKTSNNQHQRKRGIHASSATTHVRSATLGHGVDFRVKVAEWVAVFALPSNGTAVEGIETDGLAEHNSCSHDVLKTGMGCSSRAHTHGDSRDGQWGYPSQSDAQKTASG